jgi:hypothetical protein
MKYSVCDKIPDSYEPNTIYLLKGEIHKGKLDDSWNDYHFHTIYTIIYNDSINHNIKIGCVKIGEFNMGENQYSPNLPVEFTALNPEHFFTIGCNDEYYINVTLLPNDVGYDILYSLNDFTVSSDLYEKAKNEIVTESSLSRVGTTLKSVEDMRNYISHYFSILLPPINLNTMKRTYGSTGWDEIDSGLIEMQRLLYSSYNELYYNAIAVIGRQIIKKMANIVYNDDVHRDKTKYPQKPTDDKFIKKLHGFIDFLFNDGCLSENLKNYIKSSIELVQGYVHKDNGERFEGFMCVHSVITLVYQISILRRKEKYNAVLE